MRNNTELLNSILDRVNLSHEAFFDANEIKSWPKDFLKLLIDANFIKEAQPENSIECRGCEQNCFMPINTIPAQNNLPARIFIQCDKRDDIGRVAVEASELNRWHTSPIVIAEFLTLHLNMSQSAIYHKEPSKWHIGIYQGKKYLRPLILEMKNEINLLIAGHQTPLIECLEIDGTELTLNKNKLKHLVDNPVGTDETPEERRSRLLTRKQEIVASGKRAFIKIIAKEEGVSDSCIKNILRRKPASPLLFP